MFKYEEIYEKLSARIAESKPNQGFWTEMEVARHFRISRSTARKAMNMLYKEGAVYRKTKAGTFIAPARNGKKLAIVLPFERSNNHKIVDAVLENNARFGYEIDTFFSELNVRKEREILENVLRERYDGLLFLPSGDSEHAELISRFVLGRVPLVLMDIELSGFDLPLVCSDNEGGYREIVTRFIQKGYKKFLFVMPVAGTMNSVHDRYRGYCRALLENGIPVRSEYVFRSSVFDESYLSLSVKEQNVVQAKSARKLYEYYLALDDKPDAICFINDVSAAYFVNFLQRYDRELLDRLVIIGFDGLSMSQKLHFSTVCQNFYAIGKYALLTMDGLFAGETPKSQTKIGTRTVLWEKENK
ncbi:LacI family transcriptional regulator [Clostridia bacterium]|nr:LacI family transcriptional regulator [Clostridia bacterium]